jgi:putative ABC transport system permease protein
MRENTSIGDKLEFGRGAWEVVGIFDAAGSAFNSEIWCDGNLLSADLGRSNVWSSVLVRARDEAAAQALSNRIGDDQRLVLEAQPELKYYEQQMTTAAPVQTLGLFVAAIMAIGSSFAAMNTMYAAVSRRAREVGMLRVLGFSRGSILVSFLIESLLLSLLGGLIGCLLVLPLSGLESRIGNFVTFSETTFSFQITPKILGGGLLFAAVMGVLGGILPARLAARRDVLSSLREI